MLSKAITVNESRNDGLISLSIIKENEIKFHPFYRSPNAAFLAQLKEESNTTAHSFFVHYIEARRVSLLSLLNLYQ